MTAPEKPPPKPPAFKPPDASESDPVIDYTTLFSRGLSAVPFSAIAGLASLAALALCALLNMVGKSFFSSGGVNAGAAFETILLGVLFFLAGELLALIGLVSGLIALPRARTTPADFRSQWVLLGLSASVLAVLGGFPLALWLLFA